MVKSATAPFVSKLPHSLSVKGMKDEGVPAYIHLVTLPFTHGRCAHTYVQRLHFNK